VNRWACSSGSLAARAVRQNLLGDANSGGISGNKPFAVIDTEARRALHYADMFRFDHGELDAPFTRRPMPKRSSRRRGKYPCIVVDSMTHEWAGEGGVLEMQEAELERMAGNDWEKRERVKMASWIKPKWRTRKMVQRPPCRCALT